MQVAFCDFLSGLLGRGMRGSLKASKQEGRGKMLSLT